MVHGVVVARKVKKKTTRFAPGFGQEEEEESIQIWQKM